jgi:hypothetical protein
VTQEDTHAEKHAEESKKEALNWLKQLIKQNIMKMMEQKRDERLAKSDVNDLKLPVPKMVNRFQSQVKTKAKQPSPVDLQFEIKPTARRTTNLSANNTSNPSLKTFINNVNMPKSDKEELIGFNVYNKLSKDFVERRRIENDLSPNA